MSEETVPLFVEEKNEIGALVAALALAQLEFQAIKKDTQNPFFKSKYADLATIIAATQPSLAKNGLVVMQIAVVDKQAQTAGVRTMLAHKSGQFIEADLMLPAAQGTKFDAQTVGSAITYSRRYAMQSILGVSADVDDDANAATGNTGSKEEAQAVAQKKIAEFQKPKEPQDYSPQLQASIDARIANNQEPLAGDGKGHPFKLNLPPVPEAAPKPADDPELFEELSGTIGEIKSKKTKQGNPYRLIHMVVLENGELRDREMSAFDNFKLSDGNLFDFLTPEMHGGTATFMVQRTGANGKQYINVRDVKQIGDRSWENRVGVLQQALR